MPFDGFGVFVRLRNWVTDATAGVKIRADFHDTEDDNFAAGLSQCIVKDGQSTITQNIPFNSKRITALADPANPQDAATKAYADTKIAATGDGTITGNLTVTGNTSITGSLTVSGTASATGYQTRQGQPGPYTGHYVNFDWTGSVLNAWVDSSNLGALATQAFANAGDATKLPLAGGTITGNLQVNGTIQANNEIGSASNVFRFGAVGSSPGYIQWQGGSTYALGGAGTIWHSGNFNPASIGTVSNGRLAWAGSHNHTGENQSEPFPGACMVGLGYIEISAYATIVAQYRYVQLYTTGWFTVGTV